MRLRPPFALAGAVLAGVLALGCDDSTDPDIEVPIVLLVEHPSLDGSTGAGTLQLSKARVVVRTADDDELLTDTLITIGSAAAGGTRFIAAQTTGSPGQLRIEFEIEISRDAAGDGENVLVTVDLQNATGVPLFHAGPLSILVDPDDPPAPVTALLEYVGSGAAATTVTVTPASASVAPGGTFDFTATARDASGNALEGTPVEWTSLNPDIATVPDRAVGHAVAGTARGVATIKALLITGQSAQATLTVQPPATTIASQSGSGQTAGVGTTLAPFVVRITAADGLGVSGVLVAFAISAGSGGTLSNQTVTTDGSGIASSTLTLGSTVGGFTVTATAAGLAGSPVTFSATATHGPAAALAFTAQPANALSAAVLPPIIVEVRDALGNRATSYTGAVTLALDAPPAGVTLGGTLTVNAVSGIATFNTITVSAAGSNLRLRATASGLTASAQSAAFSITSGVATQLQVVQQPIAAVIGQTLRFVIEARTATGSLATGYNATIIVTAAEKPVGGAINGVVSAGFVNGVATVDGALSLPGTYRIGFRSTSLDEVLTAPIQVVVASFEIVSGNSQIGAANQLLTQDLVARVIDANNAPVIGMSVTWTVSGGGGSITVVRGVSDANGLVSARWRLGPNGAQSAQVAITSGPTATFNAQITP